MVSETNGSIIYLWLCLDMKLRGIICRKILKQRQEIERYVTE
jgi:hypothetical protein